MKTQFKPCTTLYVRHLPAGWAVFADDKPLSFCPCKNSAIDACLDMATKYPGEYGVCVEDEEGRLSDLSPIPLRANPAKRLESILFSFWTLYVIALLWTLGAIIFAFTRK